MKNTVAFALVGAAGLAASSSPAIDVPGLASQLADGQKITLIDVRSTEFYTRSHIPGAINVPAAVVRDKQLPPLGRVVVYDSGLGQTNAETAARQLGLKPGITAEILEGGFAAWETLQRETTAGRGASKENTPFITYGDLKQTGGSGLVLVDLRTPQPIGPTLKSADLPAPLTDLRTEFPGARITASPFELARRAKADHSTPPLLVLIDRNDGKAEEMGRALRANGVTRFVILSGGEEILARQGQPGLQREGTSVSVPQALIGSPPATGK